MIDRYIGSYRIIKQTKQTTPQPKKFSIYISSIFYLIVKRVIHRGVGYKVE